MKFTKKILITLTILIAAAFAIGGACAATVSISGGQISQPGGEVILPVTLDVAPNGLIYYQMTVTVQDPSVAQVSKVDFPAWVSLHNVATVLPASSVAITGGDLASNANDFHNQAGATNVPIANVTLRGLNTGTTQVTLQFASQGVSGPTMHPATQAGTLQVLSAGQTTVPTTIPTTVVTTVVTTVPTTTATTEPTTAPTTSPTTTTTTTATTSLTTVATTVPTTVPTTVVTTEPTTEVTTPPTTPVTTVPTTVPTTAPITGPTGQVYLTTTPQGARIYMDGVQTTAVTPFIFTQTVGPHQVIFQLTGYSDSLVDFEIKQNQMTTVARKLVPGTSGGLIGGAGGGGGGGTVPTGTITVPPTQTQVTTVPTTSPTQGSGIIQFPTWFKRWVKILPFGWG